MKGHKGPNILMDSVLGVYSCCCFFCNLFFLVNIFMKNALFLQSNESMAQW